MTTVLFVTYHYVRPLDRTRLPGIKGRHLDEFASQLRHLTSRYRVVAIDEVAAAFSGDTELPPDAAVLTFDDGLSDHYDYVTPMLVDHGVTGAFFPPTSALVDRCLLDVHRMHLVLASGAPVDQLVDRVREVVRDHQSECEEFEHYWSTHATPSRYDPAEIVFVKRMAQTVLPAAVRSRLCRALFESFVDVDETVAAEELYLDAAQLRLMRGVGMTIGSHGHSHQRLSWMTPAEQRADLETSLRLLGDIGIDLSAGWTLCYPYGDQSADTRRVARELGCRLAITVEQRISDTETDDPMCVPRLDTNEVPVA